MKDNKTLWILLAVVLAVAVVAVVSVSGKKTTNSNTEKTNAQGTAGGWWSGLWGNASNIIDSGGRHTAAATTSLGNAISSIIATSKSDGKAVFAEYGYSDPKINYGPYFVGGALIITAGVIAAIVLTRK